MEWRLFTTVFILHVLLFIGIIHIDGQTIHKFPGTFNIAKQRPLQTLPAQSTCGIPTRNAYCKSAIYSSSIRDCLQTLCVQDCPQRTTSPSYVQLLDGQGYGSCVQTDAINRRPGSPTTEYSTLFSVGTQCYLTSKKTPNVGTNGAFAITFWIWQNEDNFGYVYKYLNKYSNLITLI